MRGPTVPETPVRLVANGRAVASWTCSPGDLEALAAGWLLAGGFIRGAGDVTRLVVLENDVGAITIRAEVPAAGFERAVAERTHRLESGCGLLHYVACEPGALPRRAPAPAPGPGPSGFAELFRDLYASDSPRGTHAAALSDGRGLRRRIEEVGRHNAVDKTIGAALLNGEDLSALGLVVSARVSGEIALKAARAGVAWIASRSIPTTLAVRIAGAAGIPIIARAPGPSAHVFEPGGGAGAADQ